MIFEFYIIIILEFSYANARALAIAFSFTSGVVPPDGEVFVIMLLEFNLDIVGHMYVLTD